MRVGGSVAGEDPDPDAGPGGVPGGGGFYEDESASLGVEFIEEFEYGLELIGSNPHLGPRFEGESRRKLLRRFPFQIIYEVHAQEVVVVAVAHLSRRPGYWRERLK